MFVLCAGKSRKQLMDEWALDTDEDNEFDMSKYPTLPPSAFRNAVGGAKGALGGGKAKVGRR